MYLCAIRDEHPWRALGWAVDDHMRTELATTAVDRAVFAYGGYVMGGIPHSDRRNQGGFNPSSQHRIANPSVVGRQALPPVFSTPVFGGAGC
jgi:transposase InsO family protein